MWIGFNDIEPNIGLPFNRIFDIHPVPAPHSTNKVDNKSSSY